MTPRPRTLLRLSLGLAVLLTAGGGAWVYAGHPEEGLHDLFPGGDAPVRIGKTPVGLTATDAQSCGQCHTEIAAEWRQSLHSHAWTDEVFQAAYVIEPLAFCRHCHAPQHEGRGEPKGVAAAEGVSCAVCHVREGRILGSGRTAHLPGNPHPVKVVPEMTEGRFCANCHDFGFLVRPKGKPEYETEEPQQATYSEWKMAHDADPTIGTCQDCHMPWRESRLKPGTKYRSHAFLGGGDLGMLKRAVKADVTAERDGKDVVVTARISPAWTGHSFPTGDLFRRAELRVSVAGIPAKFGIIEMARVFRDERLGNDLDAPTVRKEVGDSRVPPPGLGPALPRKLRLKDVPEDASLEWSLDFLLMPTPMAASNGIGEPRNRTVVHTGKVTVAPDSTP